MKIDGLKGDESAGSGKPGANVCRTVLYHSSTVPPGSGFPRVPPVAASLGHNSRGKKTVKGITLIQSTGASPDPWVSRLVVAGDRSAD